MAETYYIILQIPSDADEREIRRAYHRLARDLHPDKASSAEEGKRLEEQFAMVSAAYNILKDPEKRLEYDKTIGSSASQLPPAAPPGGGPSGRLTPTAQVLSAGRTVPGQPTPSVPNGSSRQQNLGLTPEKIAIAQKAYTRGVQFYKEQNYIKAIDFFEAAIKNNDTDSAYHIKLAMALINAKKSATKSLEHAQRAIELDPYNLDHKFNLAFIFETIGSKTNAIKVYEEILRWDTGNTKAQACIDNLNRKKSAFGFGQGASPDDKPSLLKQLLKRFQK